MFGRTLAPSLAVGNAVVLKPAEDACDSSLRLAELVARGGLPGRRRQHRHRPGRGGRRRARSAPAASTSCPSPARPAVGQQVQKLAARSLHPVHAGARRASRRSSCSTTPTSTPPCRSSAARSSRTPGRPARPAAACWSSGAPTTPSSNGSRERFAQLRAGSPAMNLDCGPIINAKQQARVAGLHRPGPEDGIPVARGGQHRRRRVAPDGFFVTPVLFGDGAARSTRSRARKCSARCWR